MYRRMANLDAHESLMTALLLAVPNFRSPKGKGGVKNDRENRRHFFTSFKCKVLQGGAIIDLLSYDNIALNDEQFSGIDMHASSPAWDFSTNPM